MRNTEDLSRALFALIAEQDKIYKRLTYGQEDQQEWASKALTLDALDCACRAILPNTAPRKSYGGAKDWKMLSAWRNPYIKTRGVVVNVCV